MKRVVHKSNVGPGLKLCVVCGALNNAVNKQCCNCTWHGAFDTNGEHIEDALNEVDEEIEFIRETEKVRTMGRFELMTSRLRQMISTLTRFPDLC